MEIEPLSREAARRRKATALRWKQVVASVSTVSYALLAVGFFEPLLKGNALRSLNYVAMLTGIAALVLCAIAAPWTEIDRAAAD